MICRAIIRRVREESLESRGYALFLRLWAACPSGANDDIQQVFYDELLSAVSTPEIDAGPSARGQNARLIH
jgi:hypothetical protein